MTVLEWARSVKADLARLQQTTGIPALWAAAQMCHESAVGGGSGLSELAIHANNYAGLKWAEWQRSYGCSPVSYGTWEVVEGQSVSLNAAFCSCPTWQVWLQVYGDLLTGSYYGPALAYAADPLLYGLQVWKAGWATDPNYIIGVGGWMARLYEDFKDTVAAASVPVAAARQAVPVVDGGGKAICSGWIEDDRTVVAVRSLVEGLGMTVQWDNVNRRVIVTK